MLKDCSKIKLDEFARKYFGKKNADYQRAVTWLTKLSKTTFDDNQLLALSTNKFDAEPIVYTDHTGQWWTGRYIGTLLLDGITINIFPRFGMEFVSDNIPLNNFKPVNADVEFGTGENFIHYLLAILWLNKLTSAARHSLPNVKLQKTHVSPVVRGKIDIRRTLRARSKEPSHITSISTYKSLNNPVSILIALAYFEIKKWFPQHDLLRWLPDTVASRLQKIVNTVPRQTKAPTMRQLKEAKLGAISKGYIPLAKISLDILRKKGISENRSNNTSSTLLLDSAELWEIFILSTLREAISSEIEIVHGTYESDEYLLTNYSDEHKIGKLLPDYLLVRNGKPYIIGDAKYKRLGDAPWMSPKRDDLYQMTAYLSKHAQTSKAVIYYPDWGESCLVSERGPWKLESGQIISFITIPTNRADAIKCIRNSHQP